MAAPGLGASAYVGWAEESTWGTGVTPTDFYKPAGGETVRWNPTHWLDPSLGTAAVEDVFLGTSTVGGDVPLPFRYEGLEYPLKHLLGSVSTAAEGDGYKHTFTPADDLPTGMTWHIYRDIPAAKSFRAVGVKIPKGVFTVERNAPLMFTPTILGKAETLETKQSPTYTTTTLLKPSELVVTKSTFTGTIDVLSATIEVNNPLTEDRFDLAASGDFKEPQRSDKRTVTATIEGEFSEEEQYDDWVDETEGSIIFTWTGPLISGTTYYGLVMTLNGKITARPPQVSDAGPVKMTMAFQGIQTGSTPEIKLELVNSIVSL